MTDTSDDDYEVGYKRPPKSGQFKKGQSGNPKGRNKGAKNIDTMLDELMKETQPMKENGVVKNVPRKKALLVSLFMKALKGDVRASTYLIEKMQALEEKDTDHKMQPLSKPDQQILDDFLARSSSDQSVQAETHSNKGDVTDE